MSIGDKHTIGDHSFYETMFGPMVWGECEACGKQILESLKRQLDIQAKDPPYTLCERCLKDLWRLT